jgi:hypothetical protein
MESTDSYSEEEIESKLARVFHVFASAEEEVVLEYCAVSVGIGVTCR